MSVRHSPPNGRRFLGLALIAGGVMLGSTMPRGAQAPPGAAAATDLKALAKQSLSKIDGEISVPGVKEPVEVIRDRWGVTHIFAKNQDDMFYAQGYVIGQDRLWQLYMWRMTHEGRLSEILGPAAFERDQAKRMAMYRRPIDDEEWTSYHPDGKQIFTAFTNGLNAYIAQAMDNLPVEFKLTGLKPEPWKPETPLLRVGNLGGGDEITLARLVARVGAKEATRQRMPDPWSEITVPIGLDLGLIGDEVMSGGGGRGNPLPKPAIVAPYSALWRAGEYVGDIAQDFNPDPGSNNWVISGKYTTTGMPLVANDPHRSIDNPSLRYIFHLVSPGWNVIGAQEAPFVGVAIGHNERVGWGLTIAGNDQSDVFVEQTNPANPNEMLYNGAWEPFRIIREEIQVRGEQPRTIEFKVGRHGPIVYEDTKNHRAYAVRSVFQEPGTGSYLAGLRLGQATDCREFMDRANYWLTPTENLICGDVDGNISLQSSGLTPIRRGWDGRMPVPGTGRYEWTGFRKDLPRTLNPVAGFIATANHNINTSGYWPPVAFKSLNAIPTERFARVHQVLTDAFFTRGAKFSVADSQRLQHDAYWLQASFEQELFKGWTGATPATERARSMIAGWNAILDKNSTSAALYATWRQQSADPKAYYFYRPLEERRPLVEAGLAEAIKKLTASQGPDWAQWRWGRMHTQAFPHPFVQAFDLPTVERSGGTGTPFANGGSYREIFDTADWDRSVVTSTPGQSGQPESPFYANLLPLWDRQEYFPLVYSRSRVEQEAAHTLLLKPSPAPSSGQQE